ncbi:hypothetical protein BDV93DRAFT_559218 [Ceratobasidium sp. AG-I]|nr:hypothetical protein BDV93DRAFT_559218 [Ceratobasidium sp. AG-I]
MQALHALSGDNRTNCIMRFKAQLEAMLKECDSCAGIKINTQVLYEDAGGDFHIETFLTESMRNLEDAPEIDEVVRLLKDWVKATAGKNIVKEGVPITTVYPDPNAEHNLHPCIPAIIGLKGGQDKVPWERISANLDNWISAVRRPFGSPLGDPGELRLSAIITWIEYIQQCQSGAILPEKHVQYSQVIAGVSPIDPSLSQESSHRLEFIPQQNREVWIIEFSDTVTRCHAPGSIQYPKASIEYGEYLKRPPVIQTPVVQPPTEVTPNVATCAARVPDEFLGLPTGDAHPTAIIVGQEKALLLKWAHAAAEPYRTLIIELINSINMLQSHLPASTPFGIWVGQYATAMPAVLPLSADNLVDGLQFFLPFWLPLGTYSPSAVADLQSRLRYFQLFIEDMLATPLIRHAQSNTLPGGYNGTVQLARALILYLLNFAAMNGDFTPPVAPPSDEYDLTRLPLDELPNVLSWCRELIEAIQLSIRTLALTPDARKAYTPGIKATTAPARLASPALVVNNSSEPSPGPSIIRSSQKQKQRQSRKGNKAKPTSKSGDPQSDEELDAGDSGHSSDEQDYDKLDPNSDDNDLDPDGFSTSFEFTRHNCAEPTRHSNQQPIEHDNCTSGTATSGRSLPHLPEECSEIFTPDASNSENLHHAFGPFLPLPPAPQRSLPASYEELLIGVNITRTKVDQTLRDWNTLATIKNSGFTRDLQAARDAHAKAASTHVIELLPRLALVVRDVLHLDTGVAHFWESTVRGNTAGNLDFDTLRKEHSRLLKGAIEVSWIYKELLEFERLSTEWFQSPAPIGLSLTFIVLIRIRLRAPSYTFASGSLPSQLDHHAERRAVHALFRLDTLYTFCLTITLRDAPIFSLNGASLYDLVIPLVDWANEARKLDDSFRVRCKSMWRVLNKLFEARCNGSLWYWFGNPQPVEMPERLDDSLIIIKVIIDNTNDDYVDLGASINHPPPTMSLTASAPTGGSRSMAHAVLTSSLPSISSSEPEIGGSTMPGTSNSSNDDAVSDGHPNKQPDEAPPAAALTEPTTQASISTHPHKSSAKSRSTSTSTSAGAPVPARTTRSTANASANMLANVATKPRRSMRQEELGGSRTKKARL